MELPLVGESVSQLAFDYAVTILTTGGAELRFETTLCLIRRGMEATRIDPAAAADSASLLVALLNCRIEAASVGDDGALKLAFEGSVQVKIGPHKVYEAWTFAGAKGEKVVCTPGGAVTTWGIP